MKNNLNFPPYLVQQLSLSSDFALKILQSTNMHHIITSFWYNMHNMLRLFQILQILSGSFSVF